MAAIVVLHELPGSTLPLPVTAGENDGLSCDSLPLEDRWTAPVTRVCLVRPGLLKGGGLSPGALEPGLISSTLPRPPQKLTIKSGKESKTFIYTLVCTLEFSKEPASECLLLFG